MGQKIKLTTSIDDFDDVYEAVDKIRGKWIEMNKQILINLLIDHSVMSGRLIDLGEFEGERRSKPSK